MIVDVCQRWRERRDTYRPAGEVFNPHAHEVASIPDDTTAKRFVVAHHYSGTYPAARFRFGLYERTGELVGVAVYSVPMTAAVLRPFDAQAAVELGRLVLLDHVRANAESWFIAETFRRLRGLGIEGVVSFSDPEPRTDARGVEVFRGHVGTVYQALNATYQGRATPRTLRLLPNGAVLSDRALSKIRARERGWEYAVGQLVAHGAAEPRVLEDLRAWLPREIARVTTTRRHHGNHRYLWALDRAARRLLPTARPYPKFEARTQQLQIFTGGAA